MDVQVYRFFAWFFGICFWITFAMTMVAQNQRDDARSKSVTSTAVGDRVLMECVPLSQVGAK